jgi:hypothetical protein
LNTDATDTAAEAPDFKRGEIVAFGDVAVEIELVSVSGNITVRLPGGEFRTTRAEHLARI